MGGLTFPHGFIDGEWQKQPLMFGISGSVARAWNTGALGAGNDDRSDTPVPAGEVWVITSYHFFLLAGSGTYVQLRLATPASSAARYQINAPTVGVLHEVATWMVMFPGDYLVGRIIGAAAGSIVYYSALGFSMDIDL